jgi:predicted transcriptional regulator
MTNKKGKDTRFTTAKILKITVKQIRDKQDKQKKESPIGSSEELWEYLGRLVAQDAGK